MKARTVLTSGIGEFSPGIFRLGYDGGGPYRCMAISHGGGTLWAFCRKKRTGYHLPNPNPLSPSCPNSQPLLCFPSQITGTHWSYWHPQGNPQLIRQISWLLLLQSCLKLLPLRKKPSMLYCGHQTHAGRSIARGHKNKAEMSQSTSDTKSH